MEKLIKINTLKQLRKLADLLNIQTETMLGRFKDVRVDLNLFEIHATNLRLTASLPEEGFVDYIDFVDADGKEVLSFFAPEEKMIEYDETDRIYQLIDETDFEEDLTDEELENVQRGFLSLVDYDMTHGFQDEDVISLGRKYPELHLVFFGGTKYEMKA